MARWRTHESPHENVRASGEFATELQGEKMQMRDKSALTGRLRGRSGSVHPAKLFNDVLELGDVFKTPVHGSKAHVRDGVEGAQLVHHELAQFFAAHFALAAAEQLILDARRGCVDGVGSNWTLAQRQLHARDDLAAVELRAAAILLDDRGQRQLDPLVRRETLVAGRAAV